LPSKFVNTNTTNGQPELYVLDFMATTCPSCIAALPKANTLMQQFQGRMQLMLLTKEPNQKVKNFLAKRPWLSIPFAAQPQALYPYFPHEYISHLVWLNAQGTVMAITGTEYLTENNISYILAGNSPAWPVKNDIAFTGQQPSLYQSAATPLRLLDGSQQQYSALYAHDSTRLSAVDFIIDSIEGTSRLSSINQPLLHIITQGLGLKNWPAAFIRLHGVDTALFYFNPALYYKTSWDKLCSFSIETSQAISTSRRQHSQMQLHLLQQYFGISAQLKDTLICTYALTELSTAGAAPARVPAGKNQISISTLLYNYNKQFAAIPLIDNRLYKQKKIISLQGSLPANPLLLNNLLKNYNLIITPIYSTVVIMLISQKTASPLYSPSKTFLK